MAESNEVAVAALAAYYGDPERAFTQGSIDRMKAALAAARATDGGRTLTVDLDTGAWIDGGPLQPGDGYRVAAAVLPGMPEAQVERAYSAWMSADPEPPRPTRESWSSTLAEERDRQVAKGYTPQHDDEHGVRHLLNWAIEYARLGKHVEASALVWAAMDSLDRRGIEA